MRSHNQVSQTHPRSAHFEKNEVRQYWEWHLDAKRTEKKEWWQVEHQTVRKRFHDVKKGCQPVITSHPPWYHYCITDHINQLIYSWPIIAQRINDSSCWLPNANGSKISHGYHETKAAMRQTWNAGHKITRTVLRLCPFLITRTVLRLCPLLITRTVLSITWRCLGHYSDYLRWALFSCAQHRRSAKTNHPRLHTAPFDGYGKAGRKHIFRWEMCG